MSNRAWLRTHPLPQVVLTSSKVDHGLLRRDSDEAVQQFHEAPLNDDWTYLFLDGVN